MKYAVTNEFRKQLKFLYRQGGRNKDAVDEYHKVCGEWMNDPKKDPIGTLLQRTKTKEKRLNDCEKFSILERYRLITQRVADSRMMRFIGNHDASENWLNRSSKEVITVNKNGALNTVRITDKFDKENYNNEFETDYHEHHLLDRIKNQDDYTFVLKDVPPGSAIKLSRLDTTSDDDEFLDAIKEINDDNKQSFLIDILDTLRKGDLEGLTKRIKAEKGEIKPLEEEDVEYISVQSGDDIVVMDVGSQEYSNWVTNYFENEDFFEWMLFMHPKQKEIVDEEFDGPTLLNGVSGSGKTGIIVKRAIRHASENPKKPVLILTLNRSLSFLILDIINHACPKEFRKSIQVKSYFELCQDYLREFEEADVFKHYSDVTWKLEDHIDDVWREFFRCRNNNYDAKVLLEILKHFNERKIIGEKYLRDEFDWIRSRFSKEDRKSYLDTERTGRLYPIQREWRELILKGLEGWEDKMHWVGVIDYLGLSQKIMEHYSKLKPDFSNILVDEVQDFGHVELKIIRKLVEEDKNDIFLTGDENQKATVKFRSLTLSGIKIPPSRKKLIKKNYRNSKEILAAAYTIFQDNFKTPIKSDEDFEILVPEFANFSYPPPQLIEGNNLKHEVNSAVALLEDLLRNKENKQACISIVGFTTRELKEFCKKYDFDLLDGSLKDNISIRDKRFFVSDLEQMKGFEFDYVVILNCSDDIIPNPNLTEEENMTNLKLLYISMTRAREFLGLSFSGKNSKWIDTSIEEELFRITSWEDECEGIEQKEFEEPMKLEQINQILKIPPYSPENPEQQDLPKLLKKPDLYDLTGFDFLYTEKALGISVELQNKLEQHITGNNIYRDGKQIEWSTINSAINDLRGLTNIPGRQLFGTQDAGWKEFMDTFNLFPDRYK